MALGGRVVESHVVNKITTGAHNDLKKVAKIAYAQIKDFGINDAVGLVSFEMGPTARGWLPPWTCRSSS